jgi:DNA replication licensing factor MCM3
VTVDDAIEAEGLLRFALFKEVIKRKRVTRKKRKLNAGTAHARAGSDDDESDEDESSEDEANTPLAPPAAKKAAEPEKESQWDSQDTLMDSLAPPPAAAGPNEDGTVRPERYVPDILRGKL